MYYVYREYVVYVYIQIYNTNLTNPILIQYFKKYKHLTSTKSNYTQIEQYIQQQN